MIMLIAFTDRMVTLVALERLYMLMFTWNLSHLRPSSVHGLFMVMVKMNIILVVLTVLSYLFWIKWIYYRHQLRFLNSLKDLINYFSDKDSKLDANRTNGADIRALFVTAHPDDECMFFAPTIVKLVELKASVHVLCLSEGMPIADCSSAN